MDTAHYYYTWGSVRGPCAHKHRNVRTALRCIEQDHRGCASQGGYSDRVVRVHNGELTHTDRQIIAEGLEHA